MALDKELSLPMKPGIGCPTPPPHSDTCDNSPTKEYQETGSSPKVRLYFLSFDLILGSFIIYCIKTPSLVSQGWFTPGDPELSA